MRLEIAISNAELLRAMVYIFRGICDLMPLHVVS